jgi:signal transduction histidine kinase
VRSTNPAVGALFWLLLALPCVEAQERWLTKASEVRALRPEVAAMKRPVRLNGIVTYLRGAGTSDFVVQDATGGVMTDYGDITNLKVGQQVGIEGYTETFPPAPRVRITKLVAGAVVGLPEPRRVTLSEVLDGGWEGTFVEVEGVIRQARVEGALVPPRLALNFGPPHRRLIAWISRFDQRTRADLVPDASVRLRGVCLAWKTASWQPFTTFIVVNDPSLVTVSDPAPASPFTLPALSVRDLRAIRPDEFLSHRVRVRGVTTLHWPGELLILQNESGALRVIPDQPSAVSVGDEMEAVGFPTLISAHLELQGATLRHVGTARLPEAHPVSAQTILDEAPHVERDAQLVRVKGVLRDFERRSGHQVLAITKDGIRFDAVLPPGAMLGPDVRVGCDLELTGVCQMISTDDARQLGKWPDAFELLLPSAQAIRVIGAPPWWTFERLVSALGAVGILLALALLWAFVLRRRVEVRSALLGREIRARHDAELLASERQRLAADLHDTLAQTLTGAAFQLEIAESLGAPDSAAAAEHLSLAQRLLDRSRDDLRRAVWDLTPGALVGQGLVPALEIAAHELADGTGITVEVDADGSFGSIPDRLSVHLYRAAHEALSNAVRHGGARRILVRLSRDGDFVVLTVNDDGGGFDLETAPGPDEGHFGLRSLRERIQRLGGAVKICSGAAGTTITVRAPIEALATVSS